MASSMYPGNPPPGRPPVPPPPAWGNHYGPPMHYGPPGHYQVPMGYNPSAQLPMPPPLPPHHGVPYPGDPPLPPGGVYPGGVHYGNQPPPPPGPKVGPPGPPQGLAPTGFGSRLPQPGAESVPGRRKETEEERNERKKREYYEKKRQQEKQREREKGHQARPAAGGSKSAVNGLRDPYGDKKVAAGGSEKIENRLKRPSTFLCKIKFRNDLPDSTAQPKLMHINTDKDRYTRYQFTSLEKNWKHKLHVEPDLGIPLDLLDISNYKRIDASVPLDPEDAALLLDDEVQVKKTASGIRKKDRPTDKGVAWLVKTQYVSPINLDPAKQAMTEKQAKDLREQREGRRIDVETGNDREQQIEVIEESFRAAKLRPKHLTKPELEAVEILPLVPDFERMGDQYVHMVFDTDPLTDAPGLADLDQDARLELESRAIVKSFTARSADDSREEKFIGYMVPKPDELERNFYEDEDEISYTWVREYHWELRPDEGEKKTFVFCFGDDSVQYLPLSTKLVLQKKKAKDGKSKYDTEDKDFPIPASVTVMRRDPSQEEEDIREEARERFMEGGAVDTFTQKRSRTPEDDIPMSASKRRGRHDDYSDEDDEMSV
ncbi:hypothetical protein KC19_9G069500 [Ceratodon purpureus]|uniref:Uncharacterized protein n=1 Tax=Ceratodon purpureus TaxID=3225 RepID=A0A8T0GX63_CERPU|nr:hypothetical protein KC19_9G069500 [Ceratodon purpureus]